MLQNFNNNGACEKKYNSRELHIKEDFVFPKMNFFDTFKTEAFINAEITYIDVEKRRFFILCDASTHKNFIKQLELSKNLYQYFTIPPENKVFGLLYDNRVVRGTRLPVALYDGDEFWKCYLLDYGIIVRLQIEDITFKLPLEQRQIPAQAIECHLGEDDGLSSVNFLEIKRLKRSQLKFKIVAVATNYLEVSIVEQSDNYNKLTNELTEEDLEILYMETPCTSNIMKAVMGYDPQDEKRICRFYDPETGGCFKGSTCRQEHTPLPSGNWTKDVIPDSSVIMNDHPEVIYSKDEILNITPTHICESGMFYCQVNDPKQSKSPLIWSDDEVPEWKHLKKPPLLYQLVLCRYFDGFWYRAQVVTHDDAFETFQVFYVDYGNTDVVHFSKLAKCDDAEIRLPFQAILCCIENFNKETDFNIEQQKKVINLMTEMILNRDLNVKVCSQIEILSLVFIDKPYSSILKLLQKYAKNLLT